MEQSELQKLAMQESASRLQGYSVLVTSSVEYPKQRLVVVTSVYKPENSENPMLITTQATSEGGYDKTQTENISATTQAGLKAWLEAHKLDSQGVLNYNLPNKGYVMLPNIATTIPDTGKPYGAEAINDLYRFYSEKGAEFGISLEQVLHADGSLLLPVNYGRHFLWEGKKSLAYLEHTAANFYRLGLNAGVPITDLDSGLVQDMANTQMDVKEVGPDNTYIDTGRTETVDAAYKRAYERDWRA